MKRYAFNTLLVVLLLSSTALAQPASRPASSPAMPDNVRAEVYKTVGDTKLRLYIFEPEGHKATDKSPAIVFFHGGGWRKGTPRAFVQQCRYLSSRGMVAITVEYRLIQEYKSTMADCVRDAVSAVRWVRGNAKQLGIDPDRIAASGGSAGGHLAAATGTLSGFDEPNEDCKISARPNLMALFNPALDLSPEGFEVKPDSPRYKSLMSRRGSDLEKLSPSAHIGRHTPPTIIFHGTADTTVPFLQAKAFAESMHEQKRICELAEYKGQGHGFFNFGREQNRDFARTMTQLDRFLVSQGFLKGEPTVDAFLKQTKP